MVGGITLSERLREPHGVAGMPPGEQLTAMIVGYVPRDAGVVPALGSSRTALRPPDADVPIVHDDLVRQGQLRRGSDGHLQGQRNG